MPRWRHRPQGGGNRPGITGTRALYGSELERHGNGEEENLGRGRKRRRRGEEKAQGEEKSWLEPQREAREEEKKKILAAAVVAGVLGVMENHAYRFNQQTRLQSDGRSICNVMTGEVADVVMAWWKGEFMSLAKRATSHLMEEFILDAGLYAYDDSLAFDFLPPGTRWCVESQKMEVKQELVELDLQEKEDVRTMIEISKMVDSICQKLKTTFDCPGLHGESDKVPILDLQVWVERIEEEWEVVWEYYQKPCASRTLMLARSAMPDRTKRSTLTQEAIRILRNCSHSVPRSRKADLLSDFSLRMKLSGYSESYRATIIRSALAAWQKMLEEDRTGVQPLYRERCWMRKERNKEKEKKKSRWFRRLGGQTNDFTLFCPMSPGGRLAHKWRQVMEEMRTSSGNLVRGYVAEQSGIPLGSLLYSSQPGEVDSCGQDDCNPCRRGTTRKLSCRKVTRGGQVYSCTCLTCRDVGQSEAWYHGETSCTLYSRQREHLNGLARKKQTNALYKHEENHHPDNVPEFEFKTEKTFSDTASKQLYKGISINRSPSTHGYLMNSTAEYKQGEVARVEVVRGLGH